MAHLSFAIFLQRKGQKWFWTNDDDNNNNTCNKKNTSLKDGKTFIYHLSALRVRAKFKDKIMFMDIGMNLAPVIKS